MRGWYVHDMHVRNVAYTLSLQTCFHSGNTVLTRVRNFKRRCIPIFFHGDGVPVTAVGKTWSKSCDFYNWGSLLAVGAAAEVAFCIWASFLDGQVPARTKVLFWKIMRWSFDALFAGKSPSTPTRMALHSWQCDVTYLPTRLAQISRCFGSACAPCSL